MIVIGRYLQFSFYSKYGKTASVLDACCCLFYAPSRMPYFSRPVGLLRCIASHVLIFQVVFTYSPWHQQTLMLSSTPWKIKMYFPQACPVPVFRHGFYMLGRPMFLPLILCHVPCIVPCFLVYTVLLVSHPVFWHSWLKTHLGLPCGNYQHAGSDRWVSTHAGWLYCRDRCMYVDV